MDPISPLKVPIYKQLRDDNSCGPQVILMVADYFAEARGRKLYAHEWSEVLKITMGNDRAGDNGTSWRDLRGGLRSIGLESKKVKGGLSGLRSALDSGLPVIVNCTIPYKKKGVCHYAVLVGMDDSALLFADPFPHRLMREDGLREVSRVEFMRRTWFDRQVIWGDPRWAVVVFPLDA
jgi:ABC-type bacteriocin/lantibiotic exporter with double-glycine peptidase domain